MDRKTYSIKPRSINTRNPFDVEDRISWDEITPSLKEKFKRYSQGMDIQLNGDVIGEACDNTLKWIRYYDIGGNIWIEDDANKIIKEFEIHFTTQSVIEMSAAVTMTVMYEYRYDNFTINWIVFTDPPRYFTIGTSNGEQGHRKGFLSDGYSDGRDPFGSLSGGTKAFNVDGQHFVLYELTALNSSRNIFEIKDYSAGFPKMIIRLAGIDWVFNCPNGHYGSCSDTAGFWNFMIAHDGQTVTIEMRTKE